MAACSSRCSGGGDVAAGRAGAGVSEEIPTIGYRGGGGPTGLHEEPTLGFFANGWALTHHPSSK